MTKGFLGGIPRKIPADFTEETPGGFLNDNPGRFSQCIPRGISEGISNENIETSQELLSGISLNVPLEILQSWLWNSFRSLYETLANSRKSTARIYSSSYNEIFGAVSPIDLVPQEFQQFFLKEFPLEIPVRASSIIFLVSPGNSPEDSPRAATKVSPGIPLGSPLGI